MTKGAGVQTRRVETAPAFGASEDRKPQFGFNNSARFGGAARLIKDARGVAMIEYCLLAALIALAVFAGVGGLGGSVADSWSEVDEEVGEAMGGAAGNGNAGGNGNGNAGGNGNGNAGGNGNGNAGGNGNGKGNCPTCGS